MRTASNIRDSVESKTSAEYAVIMNQESAKFIIDDNKLKVPKATKGGFSLPFTKSRKPTQKFKK